jgi:methyl-accepting chemotaxis protein
MLDADPIRMTRPTRIERVEEGSQLVDEAGRTMQEIVAAIRRVGALVHDIGAANTQQRGGVTQVSAEIGRMDQATQRNAALVEEAQRAQARQLADEVAVFKMN